MCCEKVLGGVTLVAPYCNWLGLRTHFSANWGAALHGRSIPFWSARAMIARAVRRMALMYFALLTPAVFANVGAETFHAGVNDHHGRDLQSAVSDANDFRGRELQTAQCCSPAGIACFAAGSCAPGVKIASARRRLFRGAGLAPFASAAASAALRTCTVQARAGSTVPTRRRRPPRSRRRHRSRARHRIRRGRTTSCTTA